MDKAWFKRRYAFGLDANLGFLHTRPRRPLQLGLCGVSVEYRRFALGRCATKPISLSFNLANVDPCNLRKQERLISVASRACQKAPSVLPYPHDDCPRSRLQAGWPGCSLRPGGACWWPIPAELIPLIWLGSRTRRSDRNARRIADSKHRAHQLADAVAFAREQSIPSRSSRPTSSTGRSTSQRCFRCSHCKTMFTVAGGFREKHGFDSIGTE